ncbi:hypothetical protein ACHAQK_002820 [Fusarium lateritium]
MDSEMNEDSNMPWTVGPGGDIILVVGTGKIRISTNALFIQHISPVFKAMLRANMQEGNAVRNATDGVPVEIALPDDDPHAVLYGLRVQYGNDGSTFDIAPRIIRDVAIFADKYDLVQRFKPISYMWLGATPKTMNPADRQAGWDKLVAAYYLDSSKGFYLMSEYLLRTNISLLEYALGLPDENLGLRLALAIEQVRLANAYRNDDIGLCLSCFVKAKTCFVEAQPGCRYPSRHLW